MDKFDKQVERNLKGDELEKSDQVDLAIQLYEENINKILKEIIPMTG